MGSEPKEAQQMFQGLSLVIEGKLGLPIFWASSEMGEGCPHLLLFVLKSVLVAR